MTINGRAMEGCQHHSPLLLLPPGTFFRLNESEFPRCLSASDKYRFLLTGAHVNKGYVNRETPGSKGDVCSLSGDFLKMKCKEVYRNS